MDAGCRCYDRPPDVRRSLCAGAVERRPDRQRAGQSDQRHDLDHRRIPVLAGGYLLAISRWYSWSDFTVSPSVRSARMAITAADAPVSVVIAGTPCIIA